MSSFTRLTAALTTSSRFPALNQVQTVATLRPLTAIVVTRWSGGARPRTNQSGIPSSETWPMVRDSAAISEAVTTHQFDHFLRCHQFFHQPRLVAAV